MQALFSITHIVGLTILASLMTYALRHIRKLNNDKVLTDEDFMTPEDDSLGADV